MLGPGPNRRRRGAWRGAYDCGIMFSLAAAGNSDRLSARPPRPPDAPPLLQGQVRNLHDQRGLKRVLHGSHGRLVDHSWWTLSALLNAAASGRIMSR